MGFYNYVMAKNLQVGQVGVLRVMAELLLRGHSPYVPTVDDHGVDLMLATGTRIQVKTSSLNHIDNSSGKRIRYQFRLNAAQYMAGGIKKFKTRPKCHSKECEFLILHGVDENRFWIVPAFMADGKSVVELGSRPRVTQAEVMALLDDKGRGVLRAAKILGVNRRTIYDRKCADIKTGHFSKAIHLLENRWDLIDAVTDAPAVTIVDDPAEEVKELQDLLFK